MTPPVAVSKTVGAVAGNPVPVNLEGTDPKGRPVTFQIVAPPSHGRLSGDPPSLRYSPEPNFTGTDFFTFKAVRDKVVSEPATITVRVASRPLPPQLSAMKDQTIEAGDTFKPLPFTVTGDKTPAERLTARLESIGSPLAACRVVKFGSQRQQLGRAHQSFSEPRGRGRSGHYRLGRGRQQRHQPCSRGSHIGGLVCAHPCAPGTCPASRPARFGYRPGFLPGVGHQDPG